AIVASAPASALVSAAITGTGATVQVAASVVSLAGGADPTVPTLPVNQVLPMWLYVTNDQVGAVTLQSVGLKVQFSADTDGPVVSCAVPSVVLAPNRTYTVPGSATNGGILIIAFDMVG